MKCVLRAFSIGALLIFIACSSGNQSEQQQPVSEPTSKLIEEKSQPAASDQEESISSLLPGIWQSLDDPKNFMEFTETELKWSPGSSDENTEPYQVSKNCLNSSNELATELSDPKYLSVEESDLCWFIVNVDENNLELSYVGRGNTLKFRKVASINVATVDDSPRVAGVLKSVDDTGIYGLWSLKVEVNDEDRFFNYESETPPGESLIGANVEVTYTVVTEKREIDVIYQDADGQASVHGEYSRLASNDWEVDSSWQKVEGYLIAEQLAGDTPAPYFVETEAGEMVEFEEFVNESYQRINGQAVVVYYHITQKITATSLTKVLVGDSYDPQVVAINREVGRIDEKIAANQLQEVEVEIEEGGGFIKYKRHMEGNALKLLEVAYCSGHGCDQSSYYFLEDKLILKLVEKSHWVGNTDKIEEKRRYFDRQQEIFCAERSAEGEGGYDVVLKKLESFQLTEVKCGEPFDVTSIDELKGLTEENAAAYFQQ